MNCSISDCSEPVCARGWCQHHYQKWYKYGDPTQGRTTQVCSVSGCERVTAAKGLCPMHYRRQRNHGDPVTIPERKRNYTKKPVAQRFWEKVDKDGPVAPGMDSACWVWTRDCNNSYGRFVVDGKPVAAHRFSYSLVIGPIPPGHVIDHRCHTKLCVNPAHLRAVTQKQNCENRQGAQRRNPTGVRGVSLVKGKYVAHVGHHGEVIYAGRYDTLDEAAAAALAKRLELHTHNDEDRTTELL